MPSYIRIEWSDGAEDSFDPAELMQFMVTQAIELYHHRDREQMKRNFESHWPEMVERVRANVLTRSDLDGPALTKPLVAGAEPPAA